MRNSTLIIRDPFRELDTLVRRGFAPAPESTSFVPAAETFRDGDDAIVRLEIPGVEVGKDAHVEVVDGRLVISGERRDERAEESAGRRVREFRYGSFKRTFRLAPTVTAEQVSASYDAGVLTVRVGGAYAKAEGQKIDISTSAPAVEEA